MAKQEIPIAVVAGLRILQHETRQAWEHAARAQAAYEQFHSALPEGTKTRLDFFLVGPELPFPAAVASTFDAKQLVEEIREALLGEEGD